MTSTRSRKLCLAQQPDADEMLSRDPFALLVGMLLDQQIPMERAFAGPVAIAKRMIGPFDPATVAHYDPDAFVEVVAGPPAVHRFPTAMAARIQTLAKHLDDHYGGNASGLWSDVKSGDDLLARLSALPGFGAQKAKIFVALLGKQLKVRPRGWREASEPYGEDGAFKSVADVIDVASLVKVRQFKQEQQLVRRPVVARPLRQTRNG
ncbi:HhH-GPD-type base excision DNA repair protein [Kribbella sp. NPDC003505]|uniref:HhH-GPD-type base excision DNA repair protein n=1 Tax=Kribbella sp. NPDC003505 TaxID=3154448 RepID=UPI0033B1D343